MFNECKTVEEVFEKHEDILENNEMDSFEFLAEGIWDVVKDNIPVEEQLVVVRAICDKIQDSTV